MVSCLEPAGSWAGRCVSPGSCRPVAWGLAVPATDSRSPFDIPFYQGKAGRTITDDNIKDFWSQNAPLGQRRGCYVFGIRAGKGFTPGYVGKATKTFRKEAFAPHKLTRYQQFLADYKRGTPVLFFLTAPTKKGAPNVAHIADLEAFLIQTALAANPDLLNIKGTKAEEWGVGGVLRGGKGKPTVAAQSLRQMLKLEL